MHLSNLKALSSALNAKDYYTLGHAARVAAYMVLLGARARLAARTCVRGSRRPPTCTTSARSASPTACCSSPASSTSEEWELHAPAPDLQRRHHPAAVRRGARAGRAPPPRALRRQRLPRRPCRGGDPARSPAPCASSTPTTRCRSAGPTAQALTYAECLAELERCRGAQFDPDMVARVPGACSTRLEPTVDTQAAGIAAEQAAARIDADKHALLRDTRGRSAARVRGDPGRGPARGARREPAGALPHHAGARSASATSWSSTARRTRLTLLALGDEVSRDDELPEVFAGGQPDRNVLVRRRVRRLGERRSRRCATRDGAIVAVVSRRPAAARRRRTDGRPDAATSRRPSPRSCTRRPRTRAARSSTPSPTASPVSTATATCTNASTRRSSVPPSSASAGPAVLRPRPVQAASTTGTATAPATSALRAVARVIESCVRQRRPRRPLRRRGVRR